MSVEFEARENIAGPSKYLSQKESLDLDRSKPLN